MFSETIRAMTRGHYVQLEVLAELRFAGGTMYVHNGHQVIKSQDGQEWLPLGGRGRVSGLGASSLGDARSTTIGLDAEDAAIKDIFKDQRAEIDGRLMRFWGQFFDADGNLQPLDAKFHIATQIGDRLRMSREGPRRRLVEAMLEDYFARRRRSANRVVSHADQQMRDPGSTGFVYVNEMVDKVVTLFDQQDED